MVEIVLFAILLTVVLIHNFIPAICTEHNCDISIQMYFEAISLAGAIVVSVVAGKVLADRTTNTRLKPLVIIGLLIFVIIFVSYAHTIIQDYQLRDNNFITIILNSITMALLFWAGAMLGVYLNDRRSAVNSGTDKKLKLKWRQYGQVMIDNRFVTPAYWLGIVLIMGTVGVSGVARPFFVLEVIVPLVVGLFGLFITLLLANRERNKRIIENYFYKLHVLEHIWRMLDDIFVYVIRCQTIYSESKGETNAQYDQKTKELRNSTRGLYDFHGAQIKVLNTNTSVPAGIRDRVLQLVQTGGIVITNYYPQKQPQSNIVAFERHLLDPLDNLLDVEYFVKDRNEEVKSLLNHTNSIRCKIREEVDKW